MGSVSTSLSSTAQSSVRQFGSWVFQLAALVCGLVLLAGCASPSRLAVGRPFDFTHDTFAFRNELVWEYGYDASGKWTSKSRQSKPEYTHRCFVVARSAVQFYQGAVFASDEPVADEDTYRRLVRQVMSVNPRRPPPESKRVVIPGYPDLRAFSQAHERLLKSECGGAWQSYVQRGNWRVVFPFSRRHQESTALSLLQDSEEQYPSIVHVICFPRLSINHALVVYDARSSPNGIDFSIYDPNRPEAPQELHFDRDKRRFTLPPSNYFPGGPVNVYRVYHGWLY